MGGQSPVREPPTEEAFLPFIRTDKFGLNGEVPQPLLTRLLLALSACTILPLKLFGAVACLVSFNIACRVASLLPPRYSSPVVAELGKLHCRACLFCLGFVRIKWVQVGSNAGKPQPAGIVSNHMGWADILIHMSRSFPSFVARNGTQNIPLVGFISRKMNCIYVEREAANGERGGTAARVKGRMQNTATGQGPPLRPMLLFPEVLPNPVPTQIACHAGLARNHHQRPLPAAVQDGRFPGRAGFAASAHRVRPGTGVALLGEHQSPEAPLPAAHSPVLHRHLLRAADLCAIGSREEGPRLVRCQRPAVHAGAQQANSQPGHPGGQAPLPPPGHQPGTHGGQEGQLKAATLAAASSDRSFQPRSRPSSQQHCLMGVPNGWLRQFALTAEQALVLQGGCSCVPETRPRRAKLTCTNIQAKRSAFACSDRRSSSRPAMLADECVASDGMETDWEQ